MGMPHRRDGEVAVVIGGTGALGRVICERLAAEGADIAFTFRTNAKAAADLQGQIAAAGRRCVMQPVAIEDDAQVARFFDDAIAAMGRLDTLVYAAGPTFNLGFIAKVASAEWSRVIDADVKGCFNVVRTALPHLRKTKGSIVAVITGAVNRSTPLDILSVAPKAAIQALIRGVAIEEGRFGVRANCLAPGFIDGGLGQVLLESVGAEQAAALIKAVPLKRMGTPAEIADAAAYLSSAQASYVTGNTLFVTGDMEL